jgi:hypothetical protein
VKYILVIPGTELIVQEQPACPTSDELTELLGESVPLDRTNYLHNLFSDPTLVVLRSNAVNLAWVAVANSREHLFGSLLVFRKIPFSWGYELVGLTEHQIAVVRQELKLAIALRQEPASADVLSSTALVGCQQP